MPQPKLIWLMSHIDGNPLQPPAEISPSSQEWVGRIDVYFLILLTNFSGRVSPVTLDFMLTLSPPSCSVVGSCLLDLFQLRRIVVVVSANFFWSSESCHARHQINSFTSVLFSSGWLILVRLIVKCDDELLLLLFERFLAEDSGGHPVYATVHLHRERGLRVSGAFSFTGIL